jgi:hypothetical protein
MYQLRLTDNAKADFQKLTADQQQFVGRHLFELAQRPASLSRRASFPYAPVGQIYEFKRDVANGGWDYYVVQFKYSVDEEYLVILGIGRRRV